MPYTTTYLRVLAIVVLNSYITIFSTTKYQNIPCNSGAKLYFLAPYLPVHCSWKVNFFILRSHYFSYFLFFLSHFILCSHYFSSLLVFAYTLLFLFLCLYVVISIWWMWLCFDGWMKYYFIIMFILFYCVKR